MADTPARWSSSRNSAAESTGGKRNRRPAADKEGTIKAIVYTEYGPPDVLRLGEVPKPVPKDDEVLLEVRAASLNSWDWELLRGVPFSNRLMYGLLRPKRQILGSDIAGRVEAVGRDVTQFRPGDEVFGDICGRWGGFAEYACAPEDALTPKPGTMTFEQAAAIPQGALLALQGIRDKGSAGPGQQVLINGGGGGAGTFAVQIAKSFGAIVTGVDSTEKLDVMRSAGADRVIDYTREDFTENGQSYDLIVDFAAYHSPSDYRRALSPEGTYVMVGGSGALASRLLLMGPWISLMGGKKLGLLMAKPNKGLDSLIELFEAGKVVPVIDRCYPLAEVPEAFRYFAEGHARGKVVITV